MESPKNYRSQALPFDREVPRIRRILFVSHGCYLDDSNGAAVASRALMETLGRKGFAVEVLSGTMLDLDQEIDVASWIAARGRELEPTREGWGVDAHGVRVEVPPHLRLTLRGVPITLHRGPTTKLHDAEDVERVEFLLLLDATMARFGPDVVVCYGGNRLACEARALARARGAAVVFPLHNFHYHHPAPFADVDAVLVPSQFTAEHYQQALGLPCTVLPYLVDQSRIRAEPRNPKYVTFVNPSVEKGVYVFARIADELGRKRPDIPLLVVESRGTEATLAACGLNLRVHGNVNLMAHTPDPRKFWGVTRVCLLPSVWWETQALTAVEALSNGIPVLGADRGAVPETLGNAGTMLPVPARITPTTRTLPTAAEVAPWVEAIIRLWDDTALYEEHRNQALAEARRWAQEVLEPQYVRFFKELRRSSPTPADLARQTRS